MKKVGCVFSAIYAVSFSYVYALNLKSGKTVWKTARIPFNRLYCGAFLICITSLTYINRRVDIIARHDCVRSVTIFFLMRMIIKFFITP
ncbi:hypothetical protein [Pectobacterium aroidearum]|uniref:hypothetical protein n=1 Tax=Pectobacterium aroidearum TaxID=1201031 RepID=UPI0032EF1471